MLPLLSCIPDSVLEPISSAAPSTSSKAAKKGAAAAMSFFAPSEAVISVPVDETVAAVDSTVHINKRAAALATFFEKFCENVFLGLGQSRTDSRT